MTTLYRPVLIESVEQAEALGWKTPIHIVLARTQEVHDVRLFEDFAEDFWPDALEPDNRWVYVALVPIEAEETRSEGTGWIVPTAFGPKLAGAYLGSPDDTPPKRYTQTTWRTPWEEA